ncbi:NADPH:quinone oxidoreductase family protein [Sulfitobacter sp. F26204]|uniref:NADPH:quinone oxidoreductase family protein n=1 Tax=Sulfitobacter sp. F26204 TaxID=2996014 RepID=UPI00225E3371|nr:NADPH:quinone oxidoreductase family protein [Sulfitobacter sp. F26204]MCX7558763.1 NADPH:quinone oxidoreductase family protein [Sulfitobacter sp. F26204]
MRAMQVIAYDTPLALQDIERPVPLSSEVLVQVDTCGMNFGDTLMIKGTYQEKPALPFTLGMELAGTVVAVGEGVTSLAPGQRVAAYAGSGGLAEFATLSAASCVPIPDEMSSIDAAAFLIAYGTSHVALDYKARLKPAERLLVLGASGGVGLTAVELGKVMGAEVIACARGGEKLELCKAAGANHLIDSGSEDIYERVKVLGGADIVYDPIGGDQFKAAMRACNPEARLLPIGFASGEVPQIPANILLVKNMTVMGLYWGAYAKLRPSVLTDSFKTLFDWYVAGRLKPHVSNVFSLVQANDALDMLRKRTATGKVVVQVA